MSPADAGELLHLIDTIRERIPDRREQIATAVLTAIVSPDPVISASYEEAAEVSVRYADALLARLRLDAP